MKSHSPLRTWLLGFVSHLSVSVKCGKRSRGRHRSGGEGYSGDEGLEVSYTIPPTIPYHVRQLSRSWLLHGLPFAQATDNLELTVPSTDAS